MTPEEILEEERRRQKAAMQAAQQAVTNTNSGATGTVDTNNADVVGHSGTRSQQNSVSNSTHVNTGTSVSSQQGRSESYVQDNFTPEEQAEFNKRYVAAHPGYMLNENGEIVRDPKASLYDVLQVDRDRMRDERERQERQQKRIKLKDAIKKSAFLINDMIAAGIGANVVKREKDDIASNADKEIARLREQQIADDAAAKAQERAALDKWSADYWKEFNDWRREKQKHISENSSNGINQSVQQGQQVSASRQSGKTNTDQTTTYGEDFRKNRYGDYGYGHGGSAADNYIVKLRMKDGSTVDINMPKGQYESTGRYLSALYNALSKADGDNIKKVLSDAGIKPIKTGKGQYTYNGADLLSSGVVFDNPQVRAEFEKAIMKDPHLSAEAKLQVIQNMQTYPTSAPKEVKRRWWKRIADWFSGEESQGAGENANSKTKIEW